MKDFLNRRQLSSFGCDCCGNSRKQYICLSGLDGLKIFTVYSSPQELRQYLNLKPEKIGCAPSRPRPPCRLTFLATKTRNMVGALLSCEVEDSLSVAHISYSPDSLFKQDKTKAKGIVKKKKKPATGTTRGATTKVFMFDDGDDLFNDPLGGASKS